MDARPQLDAALGAFGLPATVTVPDGAPVETTAFWLGPLSAEAPPGATAPRVERHRVLVLPLADVPDVPRETLIEMAEYDGGPILAWLVDSTASADVDCRRVLVLPAPES